MQDQNSSYKDYKDAQMGNKSVGRARPSISSVQMKSMYAHKFLSLVKIPGQARKKKKNLKKNRHN